MHFAEPVLFEIPVYPRIQKYIRCKLKDINGCPEPLIATPYSQGVSLFIWLTAQSQKVRMVTGHKRSGQPSPLHVDKSGRIIAPLSMTGRIGIGITQFHRSRHQYLLNYQELEQLSSFVDVIIQQEMISYCQADPQSLPIHRIKSFMAHYDFSDDFNEESLRVAYWRYRKQSGASFFEVHRGNIDQFRSDYTQVLA